MTFPPDAGDNEAVRNATCIIRLITRLIFVWFLKEKDLVPDALFEEDNLSKLLTSLDAQESTYYKAVLQNLFFATLNQEMNTPEKPNTRKFRGEGRQHYNITSLYRYKRYFKDPVAALRLFETISFLNGGLFECLDKSAPDDAKTVLRIDGFSDRDDNPLCVPNALFFSEPQAINLNAIYGTKNSRYTVRGLIHILNRYKFTIAENTPIEEEVALDPELLGQVFENLLAAFNPETGTTARKQTGSFYTPREIVNYMVDESLIAYLTHTVRSRAIHCPSETKLRHLLSYNDEPHQFTDTEVEHLINAIDTLKILDPACGSGAFPMGILHKLVFLLGKLDPRNAQWRQRQIDRVQAAIATSEKIDDSTFVGDKFKNRGAQGQHWTNLRACFFYDDFKKEKIVWIELSDSGRFALCKDEVYLLNSAYFLLPPSDIDSKFLLGILNSSTIRFYLNLVAETSGMGTSRWINNYVKEFPIPVVTYEQQTGIIKIVNQILEVKAANSDADTTDLEQEIDERVYALYNLTQEEIAIVQEAMQ